LEFPLDVCKEPTCELRILLVQHYAGRAFAHQFIEMANHRDYSNLVHLSKEFRSIRPTTEVERNTFVPRGRLCVQEAGKEAKRQKDFDAADHRMGPESGRQGIVIHG
jgi:hypothetical protein